MSPLVSGKRKKPITKQIMPKLPKMKPILHNQNVREVYREGKGYCVPPRLAASGLIMYGMEKLNTQPKPALATVTRDWVSLLSEIVATSEAKVNPSAPTDI